MSKEPDKKYIIAKSIKNVDISKNEFYKKAMENQKIIDNDVIEMTVYIDKKLLHDTLYGYDYQLHRIGEYFNDMISRKIKFDETKEACDLKRYRVKKCFEDDPTLLEAFETLEDLYRIKTGKSILHDLVDDKMDTLRNEIFRMNI